MDKLIIRPILPEGNTVQGAADRLNLSARGVCGYCACHKNRCRSGRGCHDCEHHLLEALSYRSMDKLIIRPILRRAIRFRVLLTGSICLRAAFVGYCACHKTAADLEGVAMIGEHHLLKALSCRSMDKLIILPILRRAVRFRVLLTGSICLRAAFVDTAHVTKTATDLEGVAMIGEHHLLKALSCRSMDKLIIRPILPEGNTVQGAADRLNLSARGVCGYCACHKNRCRSGRGCHDW